MTVYDPIFLLQTIKVRIFAKTKFDMSRFERVREDFKFQTRKIKISQNFNPWTDIALTIFKISLKFCLSMVIDHPCAA